MAHTVTQTSPAKIRSAFIGNKKQALDAERATTPSPQPYNDESLITGEPVGSGHYVSCDEDIQSSGEEDEGDDQDSMNTDTANLANRLQNKERLSNLYSSLVDAEAFVQALATDGDIEEARGNQHITGCMARLSSALLGQPYGIIMDQQTALLQAVRDINTTIASLLEKVEDNGEKIDRIREETQHNFTTMTEQLRTIDLATTDTLSRVMTLEGNVDGPNLQNTQKTTSTSANASYATGPLIKPEGKADVTSETTKRSTNPQTAHHPCRLVIRFMPDGIKEEDRLDPLIVVNTINEALQGSQWLKAKDIRVVAATHNKQGNLIVSTRSDQLASDLLQYAGTFLPLISQGYKTDAREDKKWYKIQIDGVSTHTVMNPGYCRTLNSAKRVHDELMAFNTKYAQAAAHIVAPPQWLRTQEEREGTLRSSLVFAVDDEGTAKELLQGNTLAAFNRWCPLRVYQDRRKKRFIETNLDPTYVDASGSEHDNITLVNEQPSKKSDLANERKLHRENANPMRC